MKGQEFEQSAAYDEARKEYQQLILQYPQQYDAYYRLALVADHQRRFQEAQSLYTEAIRLNPRNPNVFNDLGYNFYLQGKLDKAESAVRKAVALRPAEGRFRNNLGLIYGQQHRYDEAWEQFRRGGGEADAYYNMAFVRASQNDFPAAKECFRHALLVDPTCRKAAQALRAFELAETQTGTAAETELPANDGTEWIPYLETGANPAETAPPVTVTRVGLGTDASPPRTAGDTSSAPAIYGGSGQRSRP
jgi:Flp pilus assembly protein TadD